VGPADEALAGLGPGVDGVLGVERPDGIEVPARPRREEPLRRLGVGTDRHGSDSTAAVAPVPLT
jgi:hypothetical protein